MTDKKTAEEEKKAVEEKATEAPEAEHYPQIFWYPIGDSTWCAQFPTGMLIKVIHKSSVSTSFIPGVIFGERRGKKIFTVG